MEHLLCEPTAGGECNVCGMELRLNVRHNANNHIFRVLTKIT